MARVRPGERVRVRPGERVPLDGRIVHGGAAMDESLVSGESVPVERAAPDPVVAGAMNLTGAVEIEVTRGASESTISRIAAAVRKAQTEKIPLQRAADRVAGVFVPVVMVVAAVTVGAWLLAGGAAGFAIARGVAVLVVACPCAIGLAAPIAVLVATGRSARRGILFRSGGALEALASVRAVGLDKTGTVTTGEPRSGRAGARSRHERQGPAPVRSFRGTGLGTSPGKGPRGPCGGGGSPARGAGALRGAPGPRGSPRASMRGTHHRVGRERPACA